MSTPAPTPPAAAPAGDEPFRQPAIDACVRRAVVAVHSRRDGGDEVSVGRVISVSIRHVIVAISRGSESVIPLRSVTGIEPVRGGHEDAP